MNDTHEMSTSGWVLFFSSLPTRPVNSRVKIWRRLTKAGAVQIKGSVYVLPLSEEHVEFFQWLVAEVVGMQGEAAFVRAARIDTVDDHEIVELFQLKKASDYRRIEKALEIVERKLDAAQQGARGGAIRGLTNQIGKLERDFDEALRTDFFRSKSGKDLHGRILRAKAALKTLASRKKATVTAPDIARRSLADYLGKTWATLENPFVDRMASAWLIKKFIDPQARFAVMNEQQLATAKMEVVVFDVRGGLFTHVGDLCTFEVLMRAFDLKDPVLPKMAELVHELDLKDGRYRVPAAPGVEEMLNGTKKVARNDEEALERGAALFETLYAAEGR